MSRERPPHEHPLLRALADVDDRLDDVAALDPTFLPTSDKARALVAVDREIARLEGLRLDLLTASAEVADDAGARSAGLWLAAERHDDPRAGVRSQRLADGVARWRGVGAALRDGRAHLAQAAVLVHALDALPADLDPAVRERAEARLVAEASQLTPRQLRVVGRRVLEVVAPDLAEAEEERLLRAEEERGRRDSRLTFRPRGDGSTDLFARLPDHVADRLRVYLDACTAPRRTRSTLGDLDTLPLPRRRAEAFSALLEHLPSDALPSHGGTATAVMVTIDLESLRRDVGIAGLSTGGHLTASGVRRLACTAGILPVVLGGKGQVLDLGRARRLFSPSQRKAMAVRDRACREPDCDIPAAWCEAHHAERPWSRHGRTDLAHGVLLCTFHHHRAHDPRWRAARLPNGDVRFTRRR